MTESKIYKLSTSKVVLRILFILLLILLNILMAYIAFEALRGFQNQNNKLGFIGIAISIITLYSIYYFSTIVFLFLQYYINEKGKQLVIDSVSKQLIIHSKKEIVTINENNLLSIEFNFSNKSSKNLTSEYEFVKLITVNGEIYFVTNLLLDLQKVGNIFSKTKHIVKFNNLNLINKNCS